MSSLPRPFFRIHALDYSPARLPEGEPTARARRAVPCVSCAYERSHARRLQPGEPRGTRITTRVYSKADLATAIAQINPSLRVCAVEIGQLANRARKDESANAGLVLRSWLSQSCTAQVSPRPLPALVTHFEQGLPNLLVPANSLAIVHLDRELASGRVKVENLVPAPDPQKRS